MPGSAYMANSTSGTVSVINTTSFTVAATVTVGTSPRGCCVTPDLTKAYVSNFTDGTVSVINTATNLVTATITVGNGPGGIAVTPNGSQVLVANYTDGTVSIISTASNTVTGTITLLLHGATTRLPWTICISPDSSTAWVVSDPSGGSSSTYVSALNIAGLTETVSIVNTNSLGGITLREINGICISPDASHVYVTGRNSGTNSVISTASNTIVGTMADLTGEPASIVILPDASAGMWCNSSGHVYVFNPATFAITHNLNPGGAGQLNGLAPTSDSTALYIADAGSPPTASSVWNLNTSALTFTHLITTQSDANGIGLSYFPAITEQIVMIV
jgi:YVTN family beta-propeller protein